VAYKTLTSNTNLILKYSDGPRFFAESQFGPRIFISLNKFIIFVN